MTAREARIRLLELLRRSPEPFPLDEAALLLAVEEFPDLDLALYLHRIDRLAEQVARYAPAHDEPVARIVALRRGLFEDGGFHGNREDFYDPRNSYLNVVLDRRRGIPITLAIVAISVARRLDWPLYGVNFPGHYLCGYPAGERPLAADPFHGGLILSEEEVRERWIAAGAGAPPPLAQMLAPAPPKATLVRMLNNLKLVYVQRQDWSRALAAARQMLLIHPEQPLHVRDVGMLSLAAGRYTDARAALSQYLRMVPSAPDHLTVRRCLALAEARLADEK